MTDVAALAARSAPWELPVGVRHRLERWEIDDVNDAIGAADAVLERRAELESIEQSVGIDEPDAADIAYAAAPMRSAGGVDFSQATAIVDEAVALGGELVARLAEISTAADAAGVDPPPVSDIAGVEDFASGLVAAEGQFTALTRIVEIDEQLAAASGWIERIGRWGSDVDSAIGDARGQLEAGDTEAALDTLADAGDQIDSFALTGALRLGIAGALLLVVALVLIALARRRRSATAHHPER